MKVAGIAFLAGMLFGFGLTLSEMTDPARVIGFLNIAGPWDLTLMLVMGGALLVTVPLFPLILKRDKPWCHNTFLLPVKTVIDRPLVIGAVLFGIGWGIAGFCPGPALAGLLSGYWQVALFVVSMVVGIRLASWLEKFQVR